MANGKWRIQTPIDDSAMKYKCNSNRIGYGKIACGRERVILLIRSQHSLNLFV